MTGSAPITPEQARRMSLAEQHEWFTRTAVSDSPRPGGRSRATADGGRARRGILAPFGRHLAFGADPATQMSVGWQVAGPVSDAFIRIGETPSDLSQRIPAEVRNLLSPYSIWSAGALNSVPPSLTGAAVEQYYVHAALAGLEPGRTYYYSVGHRGRDSGDVSGHFVTAPRGRHPFTFTAFGDHGVTYDAVGTTNLIRAQRPAFHLHAGDVSYAEASGQGLVTDSYDPRVWDSWFAEIEPAAAVIPWQVVVGNHEMEAWYSADGYAGQRARFDFPSPAGAPAPMYYSFIYGNVGVLALDANDVCSELPANFGYSAGAQVSWLNSTLTAMRASPEVDFIVAYCHQCAYCTCAVHGCDGGVEQYFAPAFDAHAVDLVINGHNHIYERTDPIRGGVAAGAVPIGGSWNPADGTTYITAGGAGKGVYTFSAADSYEGDVDASAAPVSTFVNNFDPATRTTFTTSETVTWSRVRYTGYCLLVVDSEPGAPGRPCVLRVRALDEDGAELDRFDLVR
jgi:hypothetical protein